MATLTVTIPDDIKRQFDEAFEGEDANDVVSKAVQRLIEERSAARAKRELRQKLATKSFAERVAEYRAKSREYTAEEIRRAREEGRP